MQLCGVGRFTLVMVGLAFLPGCRTLNLTNPNRVDAPGSAQRRLSPMATEMVQKWSDNAAKVKTLKAQPTVKLTAVDGRRRFTGGSRAGWQWSGPRISSLTSLPILDRLQTSVPTIR